MNEKRMAEALERIRLFLEKNKADPDILAAYDVVRDTYTRLVGFLMLMGTGTGPEFRDEEEPEIFPDAAILMLRDEVEED